MLKTKTVEIVKKYTSEFLLIFISVILAFAMTEWSNSNNDKVSEEKLVFEIKKGLDRDITDFTNNINGNKISLKAINYFRNWLNNKSINQDSVAFYYSILYRTYAPIINKSGYESLKATNLKVIANDSIRNQVINLYEYHYKIIETLEIGSEEMQDFKNYYKPTNDIISEYLIFNEDGKITGIKEKVNVSDKSRKELLSYFWKVEFNRNFKLLRYNQALDQIKITDRNLSSFLK